MGGNTSGITGKMPVSHFFNGLLGGQGVVVNAINNHGLIVGEAEIADGSFPAMSYDLSTGEMTVLGAGRADGVNDRGSAVGWTILDFSDVHAILYEDGDEIDLARFFLPGLADAARAPANTRANPPEAEPMAPTCRALGCQAC